MILIHNNERVICIVSDNTTFLTLQIVFNGTQAECDAEILRLNLIPLPPPYIRPIRQPRPPKPNVFNVQPT